MALAMAHIAVQDSAQIVTPRDGWCIARLLAGAGAAEIPLQTDLGRRLYAVMQAAPPGQRDATLAMELDRYSDQERDAVQRQVLDADPNLEEWNAPGEPEPASPMPALPSNVLEGATPAQWETHQVERIGSPAADILDRYVAYANARAPMSPQLFHESGALWLAATAIARRLYVNPGHGRVYPNLLMLWLAPSTLWRKTTALHLPRELAQQTFPHLLASHDATPEALLCDLAGVPPANLDKLSEAEQDEWQRQREFAAQQSLLIDELSGLLGMAGRDYKAGLIEALLLFYDGTERYVRSTRGTGRVTVRNACLSLLGASTPEAMAPHLATSRLWHMGWWPRFALLTPETERPDWLRARDISPPSDVVDRLERLHHRLPQPIYPAVAESRSATLSGDAYAVWERYGKAVGFDLLPDRVPERLHELYGRLPEQLLKISIAIAALEWQADSTAPEIGPHHMARAIAIVERWRASAHRAIALVGRGARDQLGDRILNRLGDVPAGLTARELYRPLNASRETMIQALQELGRTGEVVVAPASPGPGGGRPTDRYLLAD